jgi:hypothetical protein
VPVAVCVGVADTDCDGELEEDADTDCDAEPV